MRRAPAARKRGCVVVGCCVGLELLQQRRDELRLIVLAAPAQVASTVGGWSLPVPCCGRPRLCWRCGRARCFPSCREATCTGTLQFPLRLLRRLRRRRRYRPCFPLAGVGGGGGARTPGPLGLEGTLECDPRSPLFARLCFCRWWRGRDSRPQMLAYLRWDIVGECISGPEAVGNAYALLPALELLPINLLHPAELLQFLGLVVGVVEIDVAEIVDSIGELLPCTLPLDVASLPPRPPKTFPGAHMVSAPLARLWPRCRRRRDNLHIVVFLSLLVRLPKEILALYAVPVALRNAGEAQAECVVGGVAAVAEEQDLFPLCAVAHGARPRVLLLLLNVLAEPLLEVELGHLFLVLDVVRGDSGA